VFQNVLDLVNHKGRLITMSFETPEEKNLFLLNLRVSIEEVNLFETTNFGKYEIFFLFLFFFFFFFFFFLKKFLKKKKKKKKKKI